MSGPLFSLSLKNSGSGSLIFIFVLIAFNGYSQSQDLTKLDSAIFAAEKKIETDNRNYFSNVESLIVLKDGNVRLERYFFGAEKDSLHHIRTQTLSIVGILLGIAIDFGFIASEENLVASYFPGYFKREDTLKSLIRIKDLITMSGGMKWEERLPPDDPMNDNSNMYRSRSGLDYALRMPVEQKPFTHFHYCSGYPMIVAGIIERATRMPLDEFAKKYLFDQLEIREYFWQKDSTGFCDASAGLWLKPADVAKFGDLILHHGKWKNVQIVSESWIERSTAVYFKTSFSGYGTGYFLWAKEMPIGNGRTTRVISIQGAGGQNLYILSDYRLVIAFTESNFETPVVGPYIITNLIIPALE